MDDVRVHPEALAGDPTPYAAEWKRIRQSRRTEGELIASLIEDERELGRPHTPSEREAFAKGFFGQEYGEEIRLLAAQGLLDEEG
jgi:inosine/xanthosine triphosphate pyrophosphatase family protein